MLDIHESWSEAGTTLLPGREGEFKATRTKSKCYMGLFNLSTTTSQIDSVIVYQIFKKLNGSQFDRSYSKLVGSFVILAASRAFPTLEINFA